MKALKRTISKHKFNRVWNDSYTHGRIAHVTDRDAVTVAVHGKHVYVISVSVTSLTNNEQHETCYRFDKEYFESCINKQMLVKARFIPHCLDHTTSLLALWSIL
jgi:hypothetical protein